MAARLPRQWLKPSRPNRDHPAMTFISKIILAGIAIAAIGCGGSKTKAVAQATRSDSAQPVPEFNADSAFGFVEKQVSFGPRIPGSEASKQTAEWLVAKLNQYGATDIREQRAQLKAYNGTPLEICNITASFNPDRQKRILLLAHWDSRPWADQEKDSSARRKAIDGANDGASGVAVILEIARNMALSAPRTGVDVLFVDAEDYGRHADEPDQPDDDSTWALGTQYWVKNPTLNVNNISYAILLDMVGGKDAVFPREYFSEYNCKDINDIIWKEAARSGFSDRFPNRLGNPIVDDHVFLMQAGIPAIDIIESANPETGTFPPTWHTTADNIDNIDRTTLRCVGQVVTNVIYK